MKSESVRSFIVHFHGSISSSDYFCEDYDKELQDKFIGQYVRISLFGFRVSTNVHIVSTNVYFVGGDVPCKSDEISQVNRAKLAIEIKSIRYILKGHSHLWDRADLDASFLTLKRVYLNLKSKYI